MLLRNAEILLDDAGKGSSIIPDVAKLWRKCKLFSHSYYSKRPRMRIMSIIYRDTTLTRRNDKHQSL